MPANDRNAQAARNYLSHFLICLVLLMLAGGLIIAPWLAFWLYQSGDAGMERAVKKQASGEFVLFGSGLSQDFVDYKLELYKKVKPEIVAIGSSRVMQFRGAWFRQKFLNLGGVAGNLPVLASTINAMLKIAKPRAAIIGIDFWWFMPAWDAEPEKIVPPTRGTYNYSLASLKKPLEWLLEGKISFTELGAPIPGAFGRGFRADRLGIMAQQTDDGFGPDGSWYYTAETSGIRPALDYKFQDTLLAVGHGMRAFFHALPGQEAPGANHIDVFADIICKLKSRGVKTFIFMPPLAGAVLQKMRPERYPHLFRLRKALAERGIEVAEFTNPQSTGTGDCEFIDGFHGGEIAYARILRALADRWPALLPYVNMEKLDNLIANWAGRATAPDPRVTTRPEQDFLGLGCKKCM